MKRGYFFIMVFGVLILTSNQRLEALVASSDVKATQDVIKSQDVGNNICPVTGEKIDEKTKVTYEYKGKIYNLCCSGCIEEFKNNPEKYIKIIDEEMKNNTSGAKVDQK